MMTTNHPASMWKARVKAVLAITGYSVATLALSMSFLVVFLFTPYVWFSHHDHSVDRVLSKITTDLGYTSPLTVLFGMMMMVVGLAITAKGIRFTIKSMGNGIEGAHMKFMDTVHTTSNSDVLDDSLILSGGQFVPAHIRKGIARHEASHAVAGMAVGVVIDSIKMDFTRGWMNYDGRTESHFPVGDRRSKADRLYAVLIYTLAGQLGWDGDEAHSVGNESLSDNQRAIGHAVSIMTAGIKPTLLDGDLTMDSLLESARDRARWLIESNRSVVDHVVDDLMVRESLGAAYFQRIGSEFQVHALPDRRPDSLR